SSLVCLQKGVFAFFKKQQDTLTTSILHEFFYFRNAASELIKMPPFYKRHEPKFLVFLDR
ncbi:MAG: hypothetical protein RSG57_04925, partial [Christensenellaceae bacterium]